MITKKKWRQVQKFEKSFWKDGINTYIEETKQFVCAGHMGLEIKADGAGISLDAERRNILDIGGGLVSLLLKTKNKGFYCVVNDPILKDAPQWILSRYAHADITVDDRPAEEFEADCMFQEVWLYNCLQHVIDPIKVLEVCKKYGKAIRIFEWLDIPAHDGHPHMITKEMIDSVLSIDIPTGIVRDRNAGYGYFKLK